MGTASWLRQIASESCAGHTAVEYYFSRIPSNLVKVSGGNKHKRENKHKTTTKATVLLRGLSACATALLAAYTPCTPYTVYTIVAFMPPPIRCPHLSGARPRALTTCNYV